MPASRHIRILGAVAALSAAALGLAACAPSGSGDTQAGSSEGRAYRLGSTAPTSSIDPATSSDFNALFIIGLASAGLVVQDRAGHLQPQLATSWTPSTDELHWTVTLRKNAEFSDGSPITPADVVASYDDITGTDATSPAKSSFAGILSSVAASGDRDVLFTLAQPYADFPYLLTGANTTIRPAASLGKKWITHPVGAGQFRLTKYTPGQGVTFVKNRHYWDAGHVGVPGVEIKFYKDEQSQLLAFQSGEIDQVNKSPAVTAAVGKSGYRQTSQGYRRFDAITFDTQKAPFDNPKVRQAVAWALNRKQILSTVYDGNAVLGNDVPVFPDYAIQPTGLDQRRPDPAKVKQLLGGRTVSFTITTYTDQQQLAEVVQQQLKKVGGFDVSLKILTEAQYYDGAADTTPWLNAPVTITEWGPRLPAQIYGLGYGTGASWNAAHYSNPQLDDLQRRFEATTDEAERQALANQIAAVQWNDVPSIITGFLRNGSYLGKDTRGTFTNGQGLSSGFDFRGIRIAG